MYPERITPLAVQNRRSVKVDINNDSDGSLNEGETTDENDMQNDDGGQDEM